MKALYTIYVGICAVYSEKVRNTYFYSKVYSCAHPTSCRLAVALNDRNGKNIEGPLTIWAVQILDVIMSSGYPVIPWKCNTLRMSTVVSFLPFRRGTYITPPTHYEPRALTGQRNLGACQRAGVTR